MKKIFIDGKAGTTGLRIEERLGARDDIEIVTLPDELRKDPVAKKEVLNSVDIAFLCLPDVAAIEAVEMIENPNVCVIDTSTAHRTNPDWAYGFAELGSEFEQKIKNSKRIAVPGCHASGFIALVHPLIKAGILPKDALLSAHSLTGYSGGGKKMIADYQAEERSTLLNGPRQYALAQKHKHLPEMRAVAGLTTTPVFCPIVGDFYSGMEVNVPLFAKDLRGTMADVCALYADKYRSRLVHYDPAADEEGFLSAAAFAGRDDMEISVQGNDERILLVARFDNLGKGASGAAIQNMNILLGVDETAGLSV